MKKLSFLICDRPSLWWGEEAGDGSQRSCSCVTYTITAHTPRSHQSRGQAWFWWGEGTGTPPASSKDALQATGPWVGRVTCPQGRQPVTGTDNTLTTLWSESFSHLGGIFWCIHSSLLTLILCSQHRNITLGDLGGCQLRTNTMSHLWESLTLQVGP